MKALAALLFCAVALSAHAAPRAFDPGALEALLAPIALYPDAVVTDVLAAAVYPDDVHEAAAWLRDHPQLAGEEAVRAAAPLPWHPSLKALLAWPQLVQRMHESPQWTEDLGDAYLGQPIAVMATVHALRQRAHAVPATPQLAAPIIVPPVFETRVIESRIIVLHPGPVHGHKRGHAHRHPGHRHRHDAHRARPERGAPPPHIHNHFHQAQRARPIVQGARLVPAPQPFIPDRPRGPHRERRR